MVARHWRGWIRREDADRYVAYVRETGVDGLTGTPGNQGVQIWLRPDGDRTEIVVVSFWDSRDSIRAFAGDDIDVARFYPDDDEYLVDRERRCTHYEVALTA